MQWKDRYVLRTDQTTPHSYTRNLGLAYQLLLSTGQESAPHRHKGWCVLLLCADRLSL